MLAESHPGSGPSPGVARLVPGPVPRPAVHVPPTTTRPQRPTGRVTGRHTDPAPTIHPQVPHPAVPHPQSPPPVWAPAGKREARHLAALLARGEPVKMLAPAHFHNRKGLLILTSQRLLFMRDRWNGAMAEEFHLAAVTSITLHATSGTARVVIHCSGRVSEITDVPPAEASVIVQETQRILAHVRSAVSASAPVIERPMNGTAHGASPASSAPVTGQVFAADELPPPPSPPRPPARSKPTARRGAPAPDGVDSMMTYLRELTEMRQAGHLDEYEFALAKSRLLVERNGR